MFSHSPDHSARGARATRPQGRQPPHPTESHTLLQFPKYCPPQKVHSSISISNFPDQRAPHHSSRQSLQAVKMGRVRTKTVKKSAKVIIERYYPKLTLDFETNKRICDEIAIIASKRLRNKVRLPRRWCLLGRVEPPADSSSSDCRLHHALDEAHSAWSRPRHLVQAPGGGARAQGPVRARDLGARLHPELGERPARRRHRDQGPAQAPRRKFACSGGGGVAR